MAPKSKGLTHEQMRNGGLATKRRHGPEYFKELGRLGGLAKAKSRSKVADAMREAAAEKPAE